MDRYSRSVPIGSSSSSSSSSSSRVLRRARWSPPSVSFLGDAFNACATSAGSEVDPSLLQFTRQLSQPRWAPLLPIGNLIPQMEEEDVIVMDGVLVNYESSGSSKGTSAAMMRRNKSSEDLLCRSWEESGVCRFRSKCQFAHGKEQIRGSRIWKQKSDQEMMGVQNSKDGPSSGAGSYTYGGGSKLLHSVSLPGPNSPNMMLTPPPAITAASRGKSVSSMVKEAVSPTPPGSTFSWPPTQEEEAIITQVLYGPSSRTRLPVFTEFCPE